MSNPKSIQNIPLGKPHCAEQHTNFGYGSSN